MRKIFPPPPPPPGEVARLLTDYFVVAQLEPLISHPVPLPGQPTAQTWNAPKVVLAKPWKYTFVLRFFKFILTVLKSYFKSKEEEEDRREGKGRRWCLGDILECRSSHLASTMIWRKVFEEHPFWEGDGLVWCEPDDHTFFRSIHSAKCPFFFSSFSWNLPGAKSVVRQGIEWILSPKQQRRPLPSLLSVSYPMPHLNHHQQMVY